MNNFVFASEYVFLPKGVEKVKELFDKRVQKDALVSLNRLTRVARRRTYRVPCLLRTFLSSETRH